MKLSRKPCRIVGVRVGEATLNLLSPYDTSITAKFVLLGDPGRGEQLNSGSFTKSQWSNETLVALGKLIECMEQDALVDLFDPDGETSTKTEPVGLSFPPVPTLGGPTK